MHEQPSRLEARAARSRRARRRGVARASSSIVSSWAWRTVSMSSLPTASAPRSSIDRSAGFTSTMRPSRSTTTTPSCIASRMRFWRSRSAAEVAERRLRGSPARRSSACPKLRRARRAPEGACARRGPPRSSAAPRASARRQRRDIRFATRWDRSNASASAMAPTSHDRRRASAPRARPRRPAPPATTPERPSALEERGRVGNRLAVALRGPLSQSPVPLPNACSLRADSAVSTAESLGDAEESPSTAPSRRMSVTRPCARRPSAWRARSTPRCRRRRARPRLDAISRAHQARSHEEVGFARPTSRRCRPRRRSTPVDAPPPSSRTAPRRRETNEGAGTRSCLRPEIRRHLRMKLGGTTHFGAPQQLARQPEEDGAQHLLRVRRALPR